MGRILFIHNSLTEFVRHDLEELRQHYDVTEHYEKSRYINPAALWRQVREHDLVFGWFASWHTFLPLLMASISHKPSLLVVGGYDVAKMPAIGYGHQRGGLKKWLSRRTMSFADLLVTPSSYSRDETIQNASVDGKRVRAIYLGVPDPFESLPNGSREHLVLTVGNVDLGNLQRKGHEPFVRTAALLPDVNFVLVGDWKDGAIEHLRSIATPNVTFTGRISNEVLLDYYRRAAVYVQPSLHEGFGLSVAEAMLAGCVPVTTGAGALAEVTGECGLRINSTEPEEIAQAVQAALAFPDEARAAIRARILEEFPLSKRGEQLQQLIEPFMNGHNLT
ncbi:MAG TPA: glycosyltransferase family 4 protein [Pyrinomonadaceae bacterium]